MVSGSDSISDLAGEELVKKKLKKWIALGALNAYHRKDYYVRDWNFFFNGSEEYTKCLVDSFPRPVFFIDAGHDVFTGKSLLQTPPGNIVRTAYRDWLWNVEKKTLQDQRSSWDLMAVWFAIEKPDQYFHIHHNGYLEVDPALGCRWVISDSVSNHYYVTQEPGYVAESAAYLNHMISKQ
jgi:hypothetical protein